MKHIKIFSFLILIILAASCSSPQKQIKVMTWNIWHGGTHGHADDQFAQDSSNTENVLKVLLEHQPDIVLMQETYCCGMEIAKQAGFKYSYRGSSNLSIHSKYPIVDSIEIFKSFNSHAAVINIEGENVLFFNIWLHYLPDFFQDIIHLSPDSLIKGESATRLSEIQSILKEMKELEQYSKMPTIIGGDFNSGSHLDWKENTKSQHYNKVVEWPVSKTMEDNGFTDSFRNFHPDPLTTLQGTWGYLSSDIISDRIDYIFYKSNKLNVIDSKIIMDDPPQGFFNSDHRAILTTFQISTH